jgi:hypothetical protein
VNDNVGPLHASDDCVGIANVARNRCQPGVVGWAARERHDVRASGQ